jgi:ligand-binding sensor domain-containing protein
MEKDADGNIWFGLHNGNIVKWDRSRNKFSTNDNNQQNNIKGGFVVLNMFIDRSQHCWVSTNEGFKEFDMEKRMYVHSWLPDKNNINSISGQYCQGIEDYNDSTLVIGTTMEG